MSEIAGKLRGLFPEGKCEERGNGGSAFLYVANRGHSVEISKSDGKDGNIFWVEFWATASEESDEGPINSVDVAGLEAAVDLVRDWLVCG